jgi:hypothetical protein
MNSYRYIFLTFLLFFTSCGSIIEDDSPENIFEVFWKFMDENYVYFEEKGIDWDSVHNVYSAQAKRAQGNDDLKKIFRKILPLFRDEHLVVSIDGEGILSSSYPNGPSGVSIFDFSKNGFAPRRFDKNAYQCYEDSINHIAYLSVGSFYAEKIYYRLDLDPHPEKALKLLDCRNGIIIDLRTNRGGSQRESFDFVSAFYKGDRVLEYRQRKTGKGHTDFSEKIPEKAHGLGYIADIVPVVILCSGITFSAANFVVYIFKDLFDCTVIGLPSGGGGSPRRKAYLVGGWVGYYPFAKCFSPSGKNMEYPFEPDIRITNDSTIVDENNKIIDLGVTRAVELLREKIKK